MKENRNMLLRAGSFCILIGGIVMNLLSIFGSVTAMLALSVMDENTRSVLDDYIAHESDGMFGSSEALGVTAVVIIVVIVLAAVGLLLDIIVGVMGLSRSKNPRKYNFFLGWGIVLLVIGFFSLGELASLRGVFAAIGGIAGPVLYIIGGIQQNIAVNKERSGDL